MLSMQFSEIKIIKNLKEKIIAKDLIISKADKGNLVTILPKASCIEKVSNFINDTNCTILKKDETITYQKQVKNTIKQSTFVFEEREECKLPQILKPN